MAASRLVMARQRAALAGVVAAAASAAALVMWALAMGRGADTGDGAAESEVGAFIAARESVGRAADAPAVRPASSQAAAPSSAQGTDGLSALLRASGSDLRASVTTALASRGAGGRLYARALVRPCAALAALDAPPVAEGPPPSTTRADVNDPVRQRAQARRQVWEAGCAQLPTEEWVALMNVGRGEGGVADPLLALADGAAADGPGGRKARLAAVMAKPDGLLLDELGPRLLRPDAGGLWFDGKVYASDDEQRVLNAALRLLPCEFGMTCDEQDPAVWMACLQGDGCYMSRQAQVLAGMVDGVRDGVGDAGKAGDPGSAGIADDARRQAEVFALRDRLRDALRSQAVDRF